MSRFVILMTLAGVIVPFVAAGFLAALVLSMTLNCLIQNRFLLTNDFFIAVALGVLLNWYALSTIQRSWRVPADHEICGFRNRVWRTTMTFGYLVGIVSLLLI